MSKTNLRLRSCAVCLRPSERDCRRSLDVLLVQMEDPLTGVRFWVPPGGKIESGESSQQAALRETLEETGETVAPISIHFSTARYLFTWCGQVYDCQTDFHLCWQQTEKAKTVVDAPYLVVAGWFAEDRAIELLGYHSLIQNAVRDLLFQYHAQKDE